jgi:hypothetical protein
VITNIVDLVKAIVNGPIGKFLINALFDVFAYFGEMIEFLLDAVDGIVQVVSGVFKILTGDFKGGWEKIKGGIKSLLNALVDWFMAIPNLIGRLLSDGANLIVDAIKGIVKSIIDGIKSLATGILNFFKSSSEEQKPETSQPTNPKPTTTSGVDPNIRNWAYSVYTGKAKEDQIPANIKGQVLALRDKPEQSWIDEVNKRQKENNAPKTETKTETKPVEAQKPAATPAVDLNNKDAVAVLKAIADYQRRTVDAVNILNGNLYKRA